MRKPDPARIESLLVARLAAHREHDCAGETRFGRVVDVGPTVVRASLTGAGLGEMCRLEPSGIEAEVVAIRGAFALLSPFATPTGVIAGSLVRPLGRAHRIAVGPFMPGRVFDGMGRPLDGVPLPTTCTWRSLDEGVPDPLERALIDTPLPLGVRAIDGLLTCGRGQRVGIFAAAGGGKSTLLGMICDGSLADIIVLALIGERGREVGEFLRHTLSDAARERTVVVVATADRPALERLKAASVATAIAEHFRDQGRHVLLLMDSLTRVVRAAREIDRVVDDGRPGGMAGLPRLLERAGPAAVGSITALYTVLVEGDDLNEPVADEVRALLDGHIVLSRRLAEAGHYPAIDIGASTSRVMALVTDERHRRLAGRLRQLLATYQEIELLVRIGEYQAGQDADADEALARRPAIRRYLCQGTEEKSDFPRTLQLLEQLLAAPC